MADIRARHLCGTVALVGCVLLCGCKEQPAPAATTRSAGDTPWHYEGESGPANWGRLDPKFSACSEGRSQSPIDISNPTRGDTPQLRAHFPPADLRIVHHESVADGVNNGHTIQINYAGGETLTLGDAAYRLAQLHFHAPSEHTVDGQQFPMEMHMVHKAADGRLAVIGTLIREGADNGAFATVWSNLPSKKGAETHYPALKIELDPLLPTVRTSYRYDGSLTTPPCSEGVSWIVMATPIELSKEQIAAFTRIVHDNNRPVQPLNGRTIKTDALTITPK